MMPTYDPNQEKYSRISPLSKLWSKIVNTPPEEKKRRIAEKKARDLASFARTPDRVKQPSTMSPTKGVSIIPSMAEARASTLEPGMDLSYRSNRTNVASPVSTPTDYSSGLMAEDRYNEPIVTNTTGGAGRQMRTTVGIGGNTISYAGGPRKLDGGTSASGGMYPYGRTTPRGGGSRRLKRGETLMAPANETEGGAGDLSSLITRERAKELGIGVNQWRALNQQILANQGDIEQQMVANKGAAGVANIRSAADLEKLFANQNSPEAKATIAQLKADLDLAPLRKRLFEGQAGYYESQNTMLDELRKGKKAPKKDIQGYLDELRNVTDLEQLFPTGR